MMKRVLRLVSLVIFISGIFLQGTTMMANAAGIPGVNDKPARKKIMALLNKYDPNGAYLIQAGADGYDFMKMFDKAKRIDDELATAVHEFCHFYMLDMKFRNSFRALAVYIGNRKNIIVPYTDIYPSEEMGRTVPKRLRDGYFTLYISEGCIVEANVRGVYGLLNEFAAYSWGMNNTVSLFKYYKRFTPTMNTWRNFIHRGSADRLAYSVFKYYILNYLYYAKKHYPEVYKGIMNNQQFRRAYRVTEKRYAREIREFESCLKKIVKLANKKGISARMDNRYLWFGNTGKGLLTKEYNAVRKELSKSKYQNIHKKLIRK